MENLQLLPENAEYRDIIGKAKELGITYVGVPKADLLKIVNEKIEKINNGEAEAPEVEETVKPITSKSDDSSEDEMDEEESAAKKAAKKAAEKAKNEKAERRSSKKWYEEEGSFPYKAGDVVEIIGGKDLIGRKLQVFEPSAKKDMVKGKLVHPITGNLQNTLISIAFERIQLVDSSNEEVVPEVNENPVDQKEAAEVVEQEAVETNEEEQINEETPTSEESTNEEITNEEITNEESTDEESIIAGSEEEVNVPSMEEEAVEEEKAE